MYFPDLELLRYDEGPFRAENWSAPLLAVGWLEHPNAFPTGAIDDDVISKLRPWWNKLVVGWTPFSE